MRGGEAWSCPTTHAVPQARRGVSQHAVSSSPLPRTEAPSFCDFIKEAPGNTVSFPPPLGRAGKTYKPQRPGWGQVGVLGAAQLNPGLSSWSLLIWHKHFCLSAYSWLTFPSSAFDASLCAASYVWENLGQEPTLLPPSCFQPFL